MAKDRVTIHALPQNAKSATKARWWDQWNYDFESSENATIIGENLYNRRISLGFSQQYVADQINCSRVAITQYENGRGCPSVPVLLRLCVVLGITPNQVMSKGNK